MNLNVTEVKSIKHHPPPQKDSSNINSALHNLSIDITRKSVKKRCYCSIDIISKILHNYTHRPDVKNDKSQDMTTREPLDKFTDNLVECIKTSLP